jgi:histidinol-phosphatase (PHP family)
MCGHAQGTPEEYILTAIKKGISEFGFSDHAPLPEDLREGITMAPHETETYINMIAELTKKYDSQITIRTGFEVDFPLYDSFDLKYLKDERIDFIIGACHFISQYNMDIVTGMSTSKLSETEWAFDNPYSISEFDKHNIDNLYHVYYTIIYEAVNSQIFNIIAHFDLMKKFGYRPKKDFKPIIQKIAQNMSKYDIAAEINTSGLLKPVKEIYPSQDIIGIFFDNNVPITLGSDSHDPETVGYAFDKAVSIIKKIGYTKISGFVKRKRYDVNL